MMAQARSGPAAYQSILIRAARIAFASVALFAGVAAASSRAPEPVAAQDQPANPKLTRVEVDIWPEFDKPSALVIIHAEISPDATLPVATSLRIPTSSGGPAAVATAEASGAPLLQLPYDVADTQLDFITLKFSAPDRFFQVEFYDPLKPIDGGNSYSYTWPGDFAVDQLNIQVQQPAGATTLTVDPDLGDPVTGADGLLYRQADLGSLEAAATLTVEVQYGKADPRTTAEILGFNQPRPSGEGGRSTRQIIGIVLAVLAVIVVVAVVGVFLWRRLTSSSADTRSKRAERRRAAAERGPKCKRCGEPLRPEDRFCPVCGRTVHVKRE